MPENWSLPTITSNYATGVIQAINNKFADAITLFRGGVGSNLPVNSIRYNGDLLGTFQRWNGTAWNNMILDVPGGGSGADNAALARTNFGLGTMATQNSNAVDITGGSAVNLASFSANTVYANVLSSADGQAIQNLNAYQISMGLVNPARLANGAANSTVFLRGDQTWASPAGTLPSGLIAIFTVTCPAGWTRLAAWDGRFLRAMPTYGAMGGSNVHTHTFSGSGSHSHDAGSLSVASHGHSSGSLSIPAHGHTGSISVSGSIGSAGGHTHDVSATTGGESAGQMNCDAGQSGNMSRAGHTHYFSATTSNDGSHGHSFSGSGSVSINNAGGIGCSGTTGAASPGVSGNTGSASVGVSGTTSSVDHYPYFVDVVFCQKD